MKTIDNAENVLFKEEKNNKKKKKQKVRKIF